MYRFNVVIVAFLAMLLTACAVTPRTSTWESPKRFTKEVVYKAALQAGAENGWEGTGSDREAGTMSFMERFGKEQMVLNASILDQSGKIVVRTTANWGGGLAIKGHHEEFINNFHVQLFRKLNVSDPSERNIDIQEIH